MKYPLIFDNNIARIFGFSSAFWADMPDAAAVFRGYLKLFVLENKEFHNPAYSRPDHNAIRDYLGRETKKSLTFPQTKLYFCKQKTRRRPDDFIRNKKPCRTNRQNISKSLLLGKFSNALISLTLYAPTYCIVLYQAALDAESPLSSASILHLTA